MAARQPPKHLQGTPLKGSQGSQPGSQPGKRQQGPSSMEAEIRDLLGLWGEEEVLQVMGSKRRNADAFARLAEGLAARGHPACTPDHVRSKVKELRQGYARARDAASQYGAALPLAPFTGSSGPSWAPGTSPPLQPLLTPWPTSPSRPWRRSPPWRQAPHSRCPPRSPPLGCWRRRRRGNPPPATGGSTSPCHPGAPAGHLPRGCPPTVGVDRQLHHRRPQRAPAKSPWSRRAHRGHRCRPAPWRSTDQPQDGADGGTTTQGQPRTPSCSQPSGVSWRCRSSACGWRSSGWSSRSERWPGTRRHGGGLHAHIQAHSRIPGPSCRTACHSAHPARRSTRCSDRRADRRPTTVHHPGSFRRGGPGGC
ncbi:uncharacterized protein LOC142020795 isoform X1 [Carettochelys insculpta]|uniref:uncharacterized protein LOC142020795 isoform X1 n=1 Tax=Carettochelys insculpta TaxID=44489 RepID=UPI003EBA3757